MKSSLGRHKGRVVAFTAAAGLLLAGCGTAPSPTHVPATGSGPSSAQLVKFASCMRSHGLPNFPDPTPSSNQPPSGSGPTVVLGFGHEQFVLHNTDPRSAQFKSAMKACHNLVGLPLNPGNVTLTAKQKQAWVNVAACMRQSGFPTFPDPTFNTNGAPPGGGHSAAIGIDGAFFNLGNIDPKSAQFQSAFNTCRQKAGVTGIHRRAGGSSQ